MKKQHTPKVVAPRQKSNFVHGDLIPGRDGGGSLAWPHGQRTPTCYLAQHLGLVVTSSEAIAVGSARQGRAAARGKGPSLEAGDGSQPLRPSSSRVTQAANPQEYQNAEVTKRKRGAAVPVVNSTPVDTKQMT